MVARKDLLELFATARAKGWVVSEEDFPDDIDGEFWPDPENLFRALEGIAPEEVRYLILGQDPYPNRDPESEVPYATGIAFDIDEECEVIPKSLAKIMSCIFKEDRRTVVDFRNWIESRKILMLNCALTVQREKSGSHLARWRKFTIRIIKKTVSASPGVNLIAWGAPAKQLMCNALEGTRVFAYAGHPQPRSGDQSFTEFWETDVGRALSEKGNFQSARSIME